MNDIIIQFRIVFYMVFYFKIKFLTSSLIKCNVKYFEQPFIKIKNKNQDKF